MNTRKVSFESAEFQVADNPQTLMLIHELTHDKNSISCMRFRSLPDVLGEDNSALIEHYRKSAARTLEALRAHSV